MSRTLTAAHRMFLNLRGEHPVTPERGSLVGRTALEAEDPVHMPDCLSRSGIYRTVAISRAWAELPLDPRRSAAA